MTDFTELVKAPVNQAPVPNLFSLRIYYEDTDAGGIVYHTNYLKYFERARTEWLRQFGVSQQEMVGQEQAMFVMRSALVDYLLPARLDDELVVSTVVEKIGRASVVFVQDAWREDQFLMRQFLVRARFKLGCVDTQSNRPRAIPSFVLNAMQSKPVAQARELAQ